MIDAALAWAATGRPVFPTNRVKEPHVPHGFHDATTAPDVIAGWWLRWPLANVAIATGKPSGLVVVDVDGEEGSDNLYELERVHGALPATGSVVTPRGGSHLYFRWPGVPVKTTNNVVAAGLDIRADGGYVLVPPSRTPDGGYVFDAEVPPAPLPAWLLELIRDDRHGARAAADPKVWGRMVRDGLEQGERNSSLARLTGHLLRRWVDVDLTAEVVHVVNERRCRPPLGRREVDRIIDSVAAREADRRERLR